MAGVWGFDPQKTQATPALGERSPRGGSALRAERLEGGGVTNSSRPADAPAAMDPVARGSANGAGGAAARQGGDELRAYPAAAEECVESSGAGRKSTCQISTSNHKTTGYSIRVIFLTNVNGMQQVSLS